MRPRVYLIAVALLAGFLLWYLRDDPKAEIRRILDEFEETSKIAGAEHPLETLRLARTMAAHAAESVKVEIEHEGERRKRTLTREEIVQHLAGARRRLNFFDGSFDKVFITVTGDTARVEVRGQATGSMPGAEGQFFERRELQLTLRKIDREWLVEGLTAGPPFS